MSLANLVARDWFTSKPPCCTAWLLLDDPCLSRWIDLSCWELTLLSSRSSCIWHQCYRCCNYQRLRFRSRTFYRRRRYFILMRSVMPIAAMDMTERIQIGSQRWLRFMKPPEMVIVITTMVSMSASDTISSYAGRGNISPERSTERARPYYTTRILVLIQTDLFICASLFHHSILVVVMTRTPSLLLVYVVQTCHILSFSGTYVI